MPEIVGAGKLLVVKLEFAEVEVPPVEFADTTSKLKVVFGVSPVRATECAVVSVGSSAEEVP
jgi:hypothetical protein